MFQLLEVIVSKYLLNSYYLFIITLSMRDWNMMILFPVGINTVSFLSNVPMSVPWHLNEFCFKYTFFGQQ